MRAAGLLSPAFEKLEAHVEGMWREILGDDLSLYELKPVRERNSVAHRKLLLCSLRHAGGRRTRSYDSGRGC